MDTAVVRLGFETVGFLGMGDLPDAVYETGGVDVV